MTLTAELVRFVRNDNTRTRFVRMEMGDDDARTIFFALLGYAKTLEDGLKKWEDRSFDENHFLEDKTFLYTELAKVHSLMFAIRDDHSDDELRRFMGI